MHVITHVNRRHVITSINIRRAQADTFNARAYSTTMIILYDREEYTSQVFHTCGTVTHLVANGVGIFHTACGSLYYVTLNSGLPPLLQTKRSG